MIYFIKSVFIGIVGIVVFSTQVQAFEIDFNRFTSERGQSSFSKIVDDLYPAISYQDSVPAHSSILPLGFEVGVNATYIRLQSEKELKEVGIDKSSVIIPRLYVAVETFVFNFSATYMKLDKNSSVTGYRVAYKALPGSVLLPTVTLGVNYSKLNDLKTLDASSIGADIRISKGLPFITVYGGVGYSKAKFEAKNIDIELEKVTRSGFEYTVGGRFTLLGVANVGIQSHRVGGVNTHTLNVGIGF